MIFSSPNIDSPQWQNKQDEERELQERKEKPSAFIKQILIVDNDSDTTFTFKKAFEEVNRISGGSGNNALRY